MHIYIYIYTYVYSMNHVIRVYIYIFVYIYIYICIYIYIYMNWNECIYGYTINLWTDHPSLQSSKQSIDSSGTLSRQPTYQTHNEEFIVWLTNQCHHQSNNQSFSRPFTERTTIERMHTWNELMNCMHAGSQHYLANIMYSSLNISIN